MSGLQLQSVNDGFQAMSIIGRANRERQLSTDTVEEVWFEVIAAARIGGLGHADERRVASDRCDRRRHQDQLGKLAEVLGGGGEVEFVAGTIPALVIAAGRASGYV